jgi:hypothetical protein
LQNSSAKIPGLTTSWCLISRTGWTTGFVDHGGFPILAAIHWFHRSLRTPAESYTVNWRLFASIRIYSHPTACCFFWLLFPVMRLICKCACSVICLVASLAVSQLIKLWLRYCCILRISVSDVAPANLPVFDPLGPGGGGCLSSMSWWKIWEYDHKERNWDALRTK